MNSRIACFGSRILPSDNCACLVREEVEQCVESIRMKLPCKQITWPCNPVPSTRPMQLISMLQNHKSKSLKKEREVKTTKERSAREAYTSPTLVTCVLISSV